MNFYIVGLFLGFLGAIEGLDPIADLNWCEAQLNAWDGITTVPPAYGDDLAIICNCIVYIIQDALNTLNAKAVAFNSTFCGLLSIVENTGIWVIGGQSYYANAAPVTQIFHPHTNQTTNSIATFNNPGYGDAAVYVPSLRLIIAVGGYYSPGLTVGTNVDTGVSVSLANYPSGNSFGAMALFNNTAVLKCGGYHATIAAYSTCELYNIATDTWRYTTNMNVGRLFNAAVMVNGKVYQIGGSSLTYVIPYVESYDPATSLWTYEPSLLAGRFAHGATVRNNTIYVCGGFVYPEGVSASCEFLTVGQSSWVKASPMSLARWCFGFAFASNHFYAMGGFGNGLAGVSSIEQYDPDRKTSTFLSAGITARSMFAVAVVY